MKRKRYVKPELAVENFLVQNCIATCDVNIVINLQAGGTCTNDYGTLNPDAVDILKLTGAFTDACGVQPEGYCYHNMNGGVGIFNS